MAGIKFIRRNVLYRFITRASQKRNCRAGTPIPAVLGGMWKSRPAIIKIFLAISGQNIFGKRLRLTGLKTLTTSGFTLIEIIVVVLIIAILAAAAFANFTRSRDKARVGACEASLINIRKAIETFEDSKTTYPVDPVNSFQELNTKLGNFITWSGSSPEKICQFVQYSSPTGEAYNLVANVITNSIKVRFIVTSEGINKEYF